MAGEDWSLTEVELIVADYFAMLEAEHAGRPVNKAERNRRLQQEIGRSRGSIEFKHANISAVLIELGDLPYIDGYKPRGNYQRLLEEVVLAWLNNEPGFLERLATSPVVQPETAPATNFGELDQLIETPPDPLGAPGLHMAIIDSAAAAVARKIDFVRLDAENRRLGLLGEEWTREFEARRLTDIVKRPDLAQRIVWVSQEVGDGAGYDIRSFEPDGSPRLIEVKTTGLGKHHAFRVTPNEVAVSQREQSRYHLYRLFRFGRGPRVFMLPGALSATCRLEPSQYAARFA